MKPIGLTGHPTAQHAVALQLRAIDATLRIFIGVATTAEAYAVHSQGGEVWQCGPYAPIKALVGCIDRVLPGTTFEEIAPHVASTFADMLRKTPIAAEAAP